MTYTILHADDDAVICALVNGIVDDLKKEVDKPIEVLTATDGQQALDLYEEAHKAGRKISLVITDYNMPNKNGGNVVTAIRARDKTPIILYCSEAQHYARQYYTEYAEKGAGMADLRGLILKHASSKPRILLVEDDLDIKELLGLDFAEAGYIPIMTPNAETALEYVPSAHVIISDINQPESKGGYWLLEEARKRYSAEKLPFFLMSAEKHDIGKCLQHEAFPISKPFEFSQLEAQIRNSLPQHLKPHRAA